MTTLRKALAASAVILALAAVPARLAAEDGKAAPAQARSSVLAWFSAVWNDLAALFAAEISSPPGGPGGDPATQGSCAIDPNGNCVHVG